MIPSWSGVGRSSTTLGRWHSGYHGFEPKLTNKLGLSFWLSSCQSPAVCSRTGDPVTRCEYVPVSSASPSLARKVTVPPVPENEVYVCKLFRYFKLLSANRIAPMPPSEPPLALLQIGVAETGTSRLEGRARMRVLSVANLFHKPAGISATSGCPWGCKGLWTSKAPCPVWFGECRIATCLRARARDGELALVHGDIYTTTLGRWHSG